MNNDLKAVYNTLDALQAEDVANAIAYMVDVPQHVTVADLTLLPQTRLMQLSSIARNDQQTTFSQSLIVSQ